MTKKQGFWCHSWCNFSYYSRKAVARPYLSAKKVHVAGLDLSNKPNQNVNRARGDDVVNQPSMSRTVSVSG